MAKKNQNMEDFLSLNAEIEADVQESLDIWAKTRLSCFEHSLQLVIRDRKTEALALSNPIAKASRISSLLSQEYCFQRTI